MTAYDRLTANPPPGVYDHEIGTEHGDTCGRFNQPDEDAPRGYKPKPCPGVMMLENDELTASCPICGETS